MDGLSRARASVADVPGGPWAAAAIGFFLALRVLWPAPLGIVVEGAIIGSLTALAAFGLGLVYRANGVVNFAQADLGVVPAAVFTVLLSAKLWSYWGSLVAALACAAVLGFVVERVVVRWFARAPRLVLTIATLGLAQLLGGAGSIVPAYQQFVRPRFRDVVSIGSSGPVLRPPFEFHGTIGPMRFDGSDVAAVLVVVVVSAILVALLRFTDTGLALRASADNQERASLAGISVPSLHGLVWAIAAVLSTLALVLRAGLFGVPGQSLFGPGFLLRALAAAVIGRMQNLVVMFGAGVAIGILDVSMWWHWRSSLLVNPVLCVIIVGALVVQHRRPREGESLRLGQPIRPAPNVRLVVWGRPAALACVAVALLSVPLFLDEAYTYAAGGALLLAIVGVSLVVLTGWAGEISLGQTAFFGIGAAIGGLLSLRYGLEPAATGLVAGAVATVAALAVGIVALRVRGMFLALVTLAVAVFASSFVLSPFFLARSLYYMPYRSGRVPVLFFLGIDSDSAYYYVCGGALAIVMWWARGLQQARTARVLVGVRDNPRAAQAFGVDAARTRLTAFAVSGFVAGIAGALLTVQLQDLDEAFFAPQENIRTLTAVVVGGVTSLPGVLLGTGFVAATRWFGALVPARYRGLLSSAGSGAGLLVVLMVLPGGVMSLLYRWRDALLRIATPLRDKPASSARFRSAVRELFPFGLVGLSPDGTGALQLRDVDVSYGPMQVVFGVDIRAQRGEIVALLGTNGAGKSTLLRAISGLEPASGEVRFEGVDLSIMPPHRIARLGVVHVPGIGSVFPSLTVDEHLRVGSWLHRHGASERRERVLGLFPELSDKAGEPAQNLSGGQRQMLTLAMGLMTDAKLLLIDELSLGLGPAVVERVVAVVRKLRDDGVTVVLVEQSVSVALGVADRAYFLERGEVRYSGPATELLDSSDVVRAVFLRGAAEAADAADRRPRSETTDGPVVLRLRDVVKRFTGITALDGVSLDVREGQIVGVLGPNGAGKTTLFDIASGFVEPDAGVVELGGVDVSRMPPYARARLGLTRSFQDARLFDGLTVHQAVVLALDRHVRSSGSVAEALHLARVRESERLAARRADELIELLGVGAFSEKFVSELSTGIRRIVDLACQLATQPRVILLDEPSAGIAQREAEALASILRRVRDETNAGLVVIEHDLPLLSSIADRLVALDAGRVVAEGDPRAVLGHPDVAGSYLGPAGIRSRSRQELYDDARRAGIRGRSKMTRDELERALMRPHRGH